MREQARGAGAQGRAESGETRLLTMSMRENWMVLSKGETRPVSARSFLRLLGGKLTVEGAVVGEGPSGCENHRPLTGLLGPQGTLGGVWVASCQLPTLPLDGTQGRTVPPGC